MPPAPTTDLVIPVYEGLRHVRSAVMALGRWTDATGARLVVVDDGSSDRTYRAVIDLVDEWWEGEVEVLRNEVNVGFVRTANRGMRCGEAPTVALLNTDALVTPGWLDGLQSCLYSAEDVGIVSPLSNHANLTTMRGYHGVDHLAVAEAVRRVSPRRYPEIHLATGFCLVARRTLLEELDYFDERYGRGYFEEADLCLRAADRGWRTLADDATYVHHHGWGSFGEADRDALMTRNRERFDQRWGPGRHREIQRTVRRQRLFADLEDRVAAALHSAVQARPRREVPRAATRHAARRTGDGPGTSEPTQRVPTSASRTPDRWEAIARTDAAAPSGAGVRDVLVLADDLLVDPHHTHLVQVIDLLAEAGLRVGLATSGRFDPALLAEPCRVRPYVLSGPDELLQDVGTFGLVVATSPATVYDALLLRERDGARIATWFDPQARAVALCWPGEAWAAAVGPTLVDDHLGPAAPWGTGAGRSHDVPLGVCLTTYWPESLDERSGTILVPHDARSGVAATADVGRVVDGLRERGCTVEVYGDGVPGVEVDGVPFVTQEEEARRLRTARLVLEVGPVPGLERLRLRCAASGTPLVAAGPLSRTGPLVPLEDVHVAPRGDTAYAVDLAARLVAGEARDAGAARVASAAARVQQVPIAVEVTALVTAVERILDGG